MNPITKSKADGSWDGPASEPSDAALRINYSQDVTVEACSFLESVGGYGVAIGNSSTNCSVVGSIFDSVGQGGVLMYGYNQSPVGRTKSTVSACGLRPLRWLWC
jgi:hypothetical protein